MMHRIRSFCQGRARHEPNTRESRISLTGGNYKLNVYGLHHCYLEQILAKSARSRMPSKKKPTEVRDVNGVCTSVTVDVTKYSFGLALTMVEPQLFYEIS